MFEDFTWNLSHSIAICHKTKPLWNLQTLEKLCCTNLKFDLKLITLAKNCLWHTWNLKFSTTWNTFLTHTSNFNVETFNNSKNSLPHTFLNLNVETLNNLKKTLPHLKTYNILKKFLPHLSFIWKSCKLFVCHHLEMNSHSLCKLKETFFSKRFTCFLYVIQAQSPSLLLVLTQCPFSCLVWAITFWKQLENKAKMKDSRFMKWNNCIN
jgi:hypothetical protein